MLYDPEIMRNVAAQQREDRLKEAEIARQLQVIKSDKQVMTNLINFVSTAFSKIKPSQPVICSEPKITVSEAKS